MVSWFQDHDKKYETITAIFVTCDWMIMEGTGEISHLHGEIISGRENAKGYNRMNWHVVAYC
jgi:hypothetical protein